MKKTRFLSSTPVRALLVAPVIAMVCLFVMWYEFGAPVRDTGVTLSPRWNGVAFHAAILSRNNSATAPFHKYCYHENESTIVFIDLNYHMTSWHPLEICTFKMAARMNPDVGVCVLTARPITENQLLWKLPNLDMAPLDVPLLVNGTPLAAWYYNYVPRKQTGTSYVMWELSDALRYAYLYKFGGKYMDTDTWTLRDLSHLRDVAGWESESAVANGVLFFDKGHPLMKAALDNFVKYFNPNKWGSAGPGMITALISTEKYGPYSLLNYTAFFPVHWYESEILFQAGAKDKVRDMVNGSYAVHLSHFSVKKYWDSKTSISPDSFVGYVLLSGCS